MRQLPPPPSRRTERMDRIIQISAMRTWFPSFCVTRSQDRGLIFEGTLSPDRGGSEYLIEIEHKRDWHPKVRVLSPTLDPEAPHVYDDETLCLYHPQVRRWKRGDLLAKTVVPWTAFWLYNYESWLVDGVWYGPEVVH